MRNKKLFIKTVASAFLLSGGIAIGGQTVHAQEDVAINEANFPDANFRSYISENFDEDENGTLSQEELDNTQGMICNEANLESIKGVEYFTKLIDLYIESNKLEIVDLSQNKDLERLVISNNPLSSLDLSNNTALTLLDCSNTSITSLDISKNTDLSTLWCINVPLNVLNISSNTNLQNLYCDGNKLESLDTTQNTKLKNLTLANNQVQKLDLSKNENLSTLDVSFNPLTEVDIRNCPNLIKILTEGTFNAYTPTRTIQYELHLEGDDIRSYINYDREDTVKYTTEEEKKDEPTLDAAGNVIINATNFPDANFRESIRNSFDTDKDGVLNKDEISAVKVLNLGKSKITSLTGIEYFTALEELYCGENNLTNLDVSNLSALKILDCSFNPIADLDLSKNINLTSLTCQNNSLQPLDLSKNVNLTYLCVAGKLGALDVSNNVNLTTLICTNCDLGTLDVSKNTELILLNAGNNEIMSLDVTNNTKLETLNAQGNRLDSIDVSNNTELKNLFLGYNLLTDIDLSKNTKLEKLEVSRNSLVTLDISKNTNLYQLTCDTNELERLDISNCPKLEFALEGINQKDSSVDSNVNVYENGDSSLIYESTTRIIRNPKQFEDVSAKEWYKAAVDFATSNSYMNGTSKTTFAPLDVLTRAQFVTVLHNISGQPRMEYKDTFKDVSKKIWYTTPVMWALENKITSGISENEFGPDLKITREQLATMLLNYYGTSKLKTNDTAIDNFPDKGDVSEWAVKSMNWAVSNGIISGKPSDKGNILDPKGEATRAECAQMIKNVMEKLAAN